MRPSDPSRGDSQEAAFWSSSTCAEQARRNRLSVAEAPEPGSAVLVGPPGSGKTSFLASLGRAFESERHGEWTRFVPGRRLTALMNMSSSTSEKDGEAVPLPSTSAITYSFQMGLGSLKAALGSEQLTTEEVEVSILDTPGVFFQALSESGSDYLDQRWVQDLLRATRNARCLVLCTDVGRKQNEHRVDLSGPIGRLLGVGPRRLLRMGAKPWPARESPWERAPRLELPFERVLVLLTGIETLCNDVLETWARLDSQWLSTSPTTIRSLAAIPALGARQAAELLDPWPLARDRIEGLGILVSSLKPDAQLAVCGISTSGLETASLRRRDNPSDVVLRAKSIGLQVGEEEAVQDEAPFGIWPSLLFITKGVVHPPLETIVAAHHLPASPPWTRLR